jgi:hypothetical protein
LDWIGPFSCSCSTRATSFFRIGSGIFSIAFATRFGTRTEYMLECNLLSVPSQSPHFTPRVGLGAAQHRVQLPRRINTALQGIARQNPLFPSGPQGDNCNDLLYGSPSRDVLFGHFHIFNQIVTCTRTWVGQLCMIFDIKTAYSELYRRQLLDL